MNDETNVIETLQKANAWIEEAKPLLERGGKAEKLLEYICEPTLHCNPVDGEGHHMIMNDAYLKARCLLNGTILEEESTRSQAALRDGQQQKEEK